MKKIYIFSFLLILSVSNIFSQSGWFWQNPYPVGHNLNSVFSSGGSIKYICGDNGCILKSYNNGIDWTILQINTSENFTCCFFIDDNTGVVAGQNIFLTTDGGNYWQKVLNNNSQINSVSFCNNFTGYISGNGILFKTTNSGINWTQVNSGFTDNFIKVDCLDTENIVIATDRTYIIRSTDGGVNWSSIYLSSNDYIKSMDFTSNGYGILISIATAFYSNTHIWKTTNYGENWTIIADYFEEHNPHSRINLQMDNQNDGYLLDNHTYFASTFNGGVNWNTYNTGVQFLLGINKSGNVALLTGVNGTILKSTNWGVNWSTVSSKVTISPLKKIFFVNELTGYSAGFNSTILKTTNSGINWVLTSFPVSNLNLLSLYFTNQFTGFTGGLGNNIIYKTTNSGNSWQSINVNISGIECIKFIDQQTGYISGYPGTILKTTNSGENWISKFSGYNIDLVDIDFPSTDTGYVLSYSGSLLKTTNGGENWFFINETLNYPESIDFINNDFGFISTASGKVCKSTNGGINWNSRSLGISNQLNDILFLDNNTGYTIGTKIFKTIDSGENWINVFDFSNNLSLLSVHFINNSTGFVVGDAGTILKTTTGGVLISTNQNSDLIPVKFFLHQNYPNPFNPVTKIKFDIPSAPLSFGEGLGVRLIIFDLLGREVTTLVNEQLKPGSYEVDWDGSAFASGVYFYSLIVDDPSTGSGLGFVETKRMVMLK